MKPARTLLVRQIQRTLRLALADAASPGRRRFLQIAGGTVLGASLRLPAVAAEAGRTAGQVAIVGAGGAGLTAAYRLMKAGREVHLFEASNRFGGRMFTSRDFNKDGQFVELGAELVDTNHTDLIELAKELGLETQDLLEGEKGRDMFHFDGRNWSDEDVLRDFKPFAEIIAADAEKLYDEDDHFTDFAKELDKVSLGDYLKRAAGKVAPWIIQLMIAAYEPEFGLDVDQQSSLNLVDFIDADTSDGFHIFGDSDEALRIKGGNGNVPDALAKAIEGKVSVHLKHKLASIAHSERGITLGFTAPDAVPSRTWATVVLALPFTQLRKVHGLQEMPLSPAKKKAINEMGYGQNVKVMYGFSNRFWREPREGVISNGSVFAEEPTFQNVWETSRGQDGESGIITNLLGGRRGATYTGESMVSYLDDLEDVFPGAKEKHDGKTAVFNWPKFPQAEGSYSCPMPGQYTWVYEAAASTECGGRLLFAGEHTSFVSAGFMNGAVESGNRAAREILG